MVMIQGESLGQRAGTLPPPHDELVLLDAPDDDSMLLARLRAGDESAFRMLVDRHRPWLVRLCTRLLDHDAHAAEDAAQESLLKLHAAAHRGQPLRVRPWLTVVARNACVDEQRRRRPDLPGVLPERAVTGDDPFDLDAALSDAWSRLSGRHREVLYLREVLGFSYKEIGAIMGLSMAATETLVFRARAALKREYERSGGTSFGSALLGLQLARFGLGRRRDAAVTDGVANAVATDPGFSNVTSRLAHFVSTSLPGCGEQAIAKVLSVAAGVAVAAAAVMPGLNAIVDGPSAAADRPQATVSAQLASGGPSVQAPAPPAGAADATSGTMSLKALLGDSAPANWTPQRSRTELEGPAAPAPTGPSAEPPSARITPLRDAASAVRPADRPALKPAARDDSEPGPLRSILQDRPRRVDRSERPTPLRSLLESVPTLVDPPPVDAPPADVTPEVPAPNDGAPVEPTPVEPVPTPEEQSRPSVRETVGSTKDVQPSGDDNVAGHGPALLRRRNS